MLLALHQTMTAVGGKGHNTGSMYVHWELQESERVKRRCLFFKVPEPLRPRAYVYVRMQQELKRCFYSPTKESILSPRLNTRFMTMFEKKRKKRVKHKLDEECRVKHNDVINVILEMNVFFACSPTCQF